MEEILTLQDVPAETSALIQVTQLPIIEEHLWSMKEEVEKTTQEAMSLVCAPETIQSVKTARAELKKKFDSLEAQRKEVKSKIMGPYEKFEAVYRQCVTTPFMSADANLKEKISAVESGIISECEAEMVEYFLELTTAENLGWLKWDRMVLKIGLTEAKQKTHKKLRDQIASFVHGVSESVRSINEMDNPDELMIEYQKTLNLPNAIAVVSDRHRRLEEQRQQRAEWEAAQAAQEAAVQKVDAVLPHEPAPAPVPSSVPAEKEKVFACKFTVHGTKPQLVDFKKALIAYCEERGIRYE